MRLLHLRTISTIATMKDSDFEKATVTRKTVLSHAYCEVMKYLATNKIHPKMFLGSEEEYGYYLKYVSVFADMVGCKFDYDKIKKYPRVYNAFASNKGIVELTKILSERFDANYLFSDCTSLYFKGLNIFKEVYGDEWRKLVPIESLKEIRRVVDKTISK